MLLYAPTIFTRQTASSGEHGTKGSNDDHIFVILFVGLFFVQPPCSQVYFLKKVIVLFPLKSLNLSSISLCFETGKQSAAKWK
jgi:hypothetical protein